MDGLQLLWLPIDVTLAGIKIVLMLLPLNASVSMVLTESGTVSEVTDLQFAKEPAPMVTVLVAIFAPDFPSGQRINLVIALLYRHPSLDAYVPFPDATLMDASLLQPVNTLLPMLETPAGIVIPVKEVQS